MLLRPSLDAYDTHFAVTDPLLAQQQEIENYSHLPDCNLDRPFAAAWCAVAALWLIIRLRPKTVISTGAAPGFFCILFGRIMGARTLWIDSVANAEQLSMSGKLSLRFAHECLTQWEHVSQATGAKFKGSVL